MVTFGIALGGEFPTPTLAAQFGEVPLIRSEYLFRQAGIYPSKKSCADIVVPYINRLERVFRGDMWYRTLDVDTAEANVLAGCDAIIIEDDRLRGLRGIRRSMSYPQAYLSELQALRDSSVSGVVTPFISELAEAEWAAHTIRKTLPDVRLAAMIEVPSAIWLIPKLPRLGFSRIVIGCNDLGSLAMGSIRQVGKSSAVSPEFQDILITTTTLAKQHGLEVCVAGYFNPALFEFVSQLDADIVAVHYSQLRDLLGIDNSLLSDRSLLGDIKAKTRSAIRAFNDENGVHQTLY